MTEPKDKSQNVQQPLPSVVWDQLNQKDRLAALAQIEFQDTGSDSPFQALVKKAAALFDAQIAQVNLLDNERQFTNCSIGLDVLETPVEEAFCAHALTEATSAMIILDTHHDERFANSRFVLGHPKIRFYIGCPIRFREHKVGTLCVLDPEPREAITAAQKRMLIELAWDAEQIIDKGA